MGFLVAHCSVRCGGRLQGLQHLFRVSVGFDLVEYVLDLPVRADQESRSLDSERLLSVHVLLFDHVVSLADLLVDVREQRERQTILLFELLLLFRVISRYAQDDGLDLLEIGEVFAKLASLDRSARCVGFREEVENNLLPAIVFKRHLLPVFVGKGEIRSLAVSFGHLSNCLLRERRSSVIG